MGDHLRVCGADPAEDKTAVIYRGSSPRVRSGLGDELLDGRVPGIISACAERTMMIPFLRSFLWDHLRVCGADLLDRSGLTVEAGSSPRVRSGLTQSRKNQIQAGIISACAERTADAVLGRSLAGDHLRVCGADRGRPRARDTHLGSSPRVRSGLRRRSGF